MKNGREGSICSPPALGTGMEIYPLAYTQVDWGTFSRVCQDTLGVSPSKGIDSSYLELADPGSFLGCLDLENNPLQALRKQKLLEHYSFSFIAILDEEELLHLQSNTALSIYSKPANRKEYVVILSGNMRAWVLALEALLDLDAPYFAKKIGTCCLSYFQQTGLRELFTKYKKTKNQDGTTVLE